MAGVGAVVLFTSRLEAVAEFYRALGVPLESESHDEGDPHLACDIGGVHFAVFSSGDAGRAPQFGTSGCTFVGIAVASAHAAVAAVRDLGAAVLQEPADYPWGLRAVVVDPDDRPVEVFESR